ncbi:AIR synthase related protein [Occultella kanbiaonis]|uniref:AIR synthase related protein n=1 Tax=Occultella kanbiaonis TaxID=2675754 RepID=UPI0013D359BE|nr:AIR synthase related protein [Occultella kanbiaonis]
MSISLPRVTAVRDLLVLDGGGPLVIACDSVGGIGPKPADTFRADPWTTAHFATRVPLLEVLCTGAQPVVVVNTLSVARAGIGEEMIAAVRQLATRVGVTPDGVTGSTEDNVATNATGIGVTVVAALPAGAGPLGGGSRAGDVVLCAGLPRSAPEFTLYSGHPDLVDLAEVRAAVASGLVHDALPVGSKGLSWEGPQLAASAGLTIRWRAARPVDLGASGGPSSCVLLACAAPDEAALRALFAPSLPVHAVADLEAPA